jgi:pyruvate/2-oxoglutarate/acetoin dehydrogenase E1 component
VMAIGMPHVPIPFSPPLEKSLLPNASRLVSAVHELLGS